jgi:hypothetical protein
MAQQQQQEGRVYVAGMNLRQALITGPPDAIKVNVTSAQGKANKNRRDFSPMTHKEEGYKGFWNFESFWQSGKVFAGIDEGKVKEYWHNIKEPKRRYPNSKGKEVLYARFEHLPDEKMDYVTSRKKIYVPCYFEEMKDTEMATYWRKQVQQGQDIIIYDFDGPRLQDGTPTYLELTRELLIDKINDITRPFGHGYVVAAWLKGITPDEYTG